jgi:hypothetical protein
MRIEALTEQCLYESGARGIDSRAEEIALVAMALAPEGAYRMKDYRRRIREVYLSQDKQYGSIFLIFVLPILISIISQWIAKWIVNRTTEDLMEMKTGARASLAASSPGLMERLTSTSSPPEKRTTP